MKPGNLFIQGAKSGGKRKMRIWSDFFTRIRSSGVRFFYLQKGKNKHGKKTLYL